MNTDKIYAESIVNEYSKKEDSKVVALKKLDKKAKLPATIFTYTFGVIAALVVGVGLCLSMGVLGNGSTASFVAGVIIGVIGLAMCGLNLPLYHKMLANGKEKYASDIMALAKQIAEEE